MNGTKFHKYVLVIALLFVSPFAGCTSIQPSTPPASIEESSAYQAFKKRPVNDCSRLIYLIDHFKESDLEINYDGYYYKAPFAAAIARAFLAANYRRETVPQWIMKWCNTTIGGHLIYVKFPDGKHRLSRDVLLDESKSLERAITSP